MMTSSLRLALLLATGSLLTACPLAPTCGGFDGGGDRVYAQANGDSAIACENGGFIATRENVAMEGRISNTSVTDGPTGALAFVFAAAEWTPVEMNEVTLDHADTLCQDLTTRAWWTAAPLEHLPIATAFTKPAEGFASVEACRAENPDGICEDQMLLCPDGSAQLATAEGDDVGTYSTLAGELDILTSTWGFSGTYETGALETISLAPGTGTTVHWKTTASAGVSLSCK
jgi:hypothetical protein